MLMTHPLVVIYFSTIFHVTHPLTILLPLLPPPPDIHSLLPSSFPLPPSYHPPSPSLPLTLLLPPHSLLPPPPRILYQGTWALTATKLPQITTLYDSLAVALGVTGLPEAELCRLQLALNYVLLADFASAKPILSSAGDQRTCYHINTMHPINTRFQYTISKKQNQDTISMQPFNPYNTHPIITTHPLYAYLNAKPIISMHPLIAVHQHTMYCTHSHPFSTPLSPSLTPPHPPDSTGKLISQLLGHRHTLSPPLTPSHTLSPLSATGKLISQLLGHRHIAVGEALYVLGLFKYHTGKYSDARALFIRCHEVASPAHTHTLPSHISSSHISPLSHSPLTPPHTLSHTYPSPPLTPSLSPLP